MEINGLHGGERIYVLGDGPSLQLATGHNLHPNIMCNYVPTRPHGIRPDYHVFIDGYFWRKSRQIPLSLSCPVFTTAVFRPDHDTGDIPARFLRFKRWPNDWATNPWSTFLSERYENGLYYRNTVIFACINLAYVMGATEIALLGVDQGESYISYDRDLGMPIPHRDEILAELKETARFLRSKGVGPINLSPMSCVEDWDKEGL